MGRLDLIQPPEGDTQPIMGLCAVLFRQGCCKRGPRPPPIATGKGGLSSRNLGLI
jgi:hypothetical protein